MNSIKVLVALRDEMCNDTADLKVIKIQSEPASDGFEITKYVVVSSTSTRVIGVYSNQLAVESYVRRKNQSLDTVERPRVTMVIHEWHGLYVTPTPVESKEYPVVWSINEMLIAMSGRGCL